MENDLVIQGPSLILRKALGKDINKLIDVSKHPDEFEYTGWGPFYNKEVTLEFIEWINNSSPLARKIAFVVEKDNQLVGITYLSDISSGNKRATITTWIESSFRGTGINTEVKALMAELAFDYIGLNRINAGVIDINQRSQKALEKTSFTLEAELKDWFVNKDIKHVGLFYRLTDDEWRESDLKVQSKFIGVLPPHLQLRSQ